MDIIDRDRYRRERDNPSFSSTLLDAIYRSIDQRDDDEQVVFYRETMRKKQSNFVVQRMNGSFQNDDDCQQDILRRACLVDKWMEKKVSEKVVLSRKSAGPGDFLDTSSHRREGERERDSLYFNSSSSSSDSSCGGGFSSSEAESVYGVPSRPKPIRTSVTYQQDEYVKREKQRANSGHSYQLEDQNYASSQQKSKLEGKFVKTKSRALKIYGDLKKVKQPISPGGRLANFLNSIFTAGNTKKGKISSSSAGGYGNAMSMERKSKSANASTCSSASSFSRSCLSKTPSSRGKSSNGMQRSVRFYPVSVLVDEDSRPCGHKSLFGGEPDLKAASNTINEELRMHLREKNRRVEEAARNLLKNYQKKVECEFDLIRNDMNEEIDLMNVEEDDDDAASYASSDLFELDNLSAIGMERYREELPVYETTHLDTNRAIANGLLV